MKRTAIVMLFVLFIFVLLFTTNTTPPRHNPNQRNAIVSVTTQPLLWMPAGFQVVPTTTTTTTTVPPTTTTTTAPVPTQPAWDTVTPEQRIEWTRVAVCEEGGWVGYAGPAYPDSLGISAANWVAYGGTSDLSEDAQIIVAERIQFNPPDQNGCASW